MTEHRLVLLIARQLSGELTTEEFRELEEWAVINPTNKLLLDRITNEEELEKEVRRWIDPAQGYDRWMDGMKAHRRSLIIKIAGWSVAASLLIAIGLVGLHNKTMNKQPGNVTVAVSQPVLPGRNVATLVLANGRQIVLDSAGNGDLAMEGKTRLVKADNSSLSYIGAAADKSSTMTYNMLTTPRSGQYRLVLPDGSRVWLNNVSSLRYPTAFLGKERVVELTGEAYFEIAKDVAKPFFVKVKEETVEVLGTSFNIKAYSEETSMQTTLLSGAVQVRFGKSIAVLHPDEQARVNESGKLETIKEVPSEDIVSWKNGFFYFGKESLRGVMRQLARWYDVDVVYDGNVPDQEFGGKIDRNLTLNDLLKFLDKNQVHFRLEGRKLIVLP